MVRTVCAVAGSMSFLDEIDAEGRDAGLVRAIASRQTPPIFDRLLDTFSLQGISDATARTYIARYGNATWSSLATGLRNDAACPKLRDFWSYESCRYDKSSLSCSEPDHIDACPVPRPRLRNGRLNQMAASLYLFVRDIADGDLIGWIDRQLATASAAPSSEQEIARQEALIGPLRDVYGLSDKVLTMALSVLLIAGRHQRPRWFETGKAMIAVDTLVHNFLHRTGILQDCGKPHLYGAGCYRPGGCAEILRALAQRIDTRQFNPVFPSYFPRFVQHAIWRFCSADGINLCNGNRIDDRKACQIAYCYLNAACGRKPLKA